MFKLIRKRYLVVISLVFLTASIFGYYIYNALKSNLDGVVSFLKVARIFSLFSIILFAIFAIIFKYKLKFKLDAKYYFIALVFVFIFAFSNIICYKTQTENAFTKIKYTNNLEIKLTNQPVLDENQMVCDGELYKVNGQELENKFNKIKIYILNMPNYSNINIANLPFGYGDVIRFKGEINLPENATIEGEFDYKEWLTNKGISGTSYIDFSCIDKVGKFRANFIKQWGYLAKQKIVLSLEKVLPKEQAMLVSAMLISYKDELSGDTKDAFSKSGLSHIMAVSGFNVSIIAVLVMLLCRFLGIGVKKGYVITFFALIAFVFVTGFSASIVRAVIMANLLIISRFAERENDIFTTIMFAVMILLLIQPTIFMDVGFQLSFVAVVALFLTTKNLNKLTEKFSNGSKLKTEFLNAAFTCIAVQIATIPITVFAFNSVSFVGIISNILVVPTLFALSVLGILVILLGLVNLDWIVVPFLRIVISYIVGVTSWTSNMQLSNFGVETPNVIFVVLYFIMLVIATSYKKLKFGAEKAKVFGIFIVIVIGLVVFGDSNYLYTTQITFFDVGQGDCSLYKLPDGKTILIDAGDGKKDMSTILYANKVDVINYLVATHSHADHIGGVKKILQNHIVENILVSGAEDLNLYSDMLSGLSGKQQLKVKPKIIRAFAGMSIVLGKEGALKVLSPSQVINAKDPNQASIVTLFQYKQFELVSCADIDSDIEKALLKTALDVDVLKVAHHGSKYSSSQMFIDKYLPEISVISVGRNLYGHPSAEVLKRLQADNSNVYRTDVAGTIQIATDGNKYKISRANIQ